MMKVSRLTASDVDTDLLATLTTDSLFVSPAFARIWEEQGGRLVYWAAESDGEIIALLPGIEFGTRPLRRFQAMPDGLGGRILTESPEDPASLKVVTSLFDAVVDAGYIKAFFTDFENAVDVPDVYEALPCSSTVIDISDDNWTPPDRKLQSAIRKADREQVVVQKFCADNHLDKFMRLMTAAERRHHRDQRYSRGFFSALAALAASDDRVIWYYCESGDQPVASHIRFIEGDTVHCWQAYHDPKFSHLKANQYMMWGLTVEMRQRGVGRLSLGSTPPEAPGVAEYKARWGGRSYFYACYAFKSRLGKLL